MRLFILAATATASLTLLSIPSMAENGTGASTKAQTYPGGWCTTVKTSSGRWQRVCFPSSR
jgi:hypothetical protein